MRARAVLSSVLLAGVVVAGAPALAHHDCGNEKSQDAKEREACERERERREQEQARKGGGSKSQGKGRESAPPSPPREEWAEQDTSRTELRLVVSADLVADWVPDRYQVALDGGSATIYITARAFTGAEGATAVVHEASVEVSAPDGSAGVHSYLLWQVTDAQWLEAKLRRVGLPVHRLTAPYTSTSAGVLAQVQADVALGDVDYSFTGSVRESAGASTGTPTVIWYDGFLGPVRAATTCTTCGTPGEGVVSVSAGAGSRVAAYLSGEVHLTSASLVRSSGATVAVVVG